MNLDRKTSVLGLELDRHSMAAIELSRTGAGAAHRAELSVDLLTGDAELAGRELRNALEAGGLRTRRCAVCIPLEWVMVHQTELPEIAEEDVASFIQLEAERVFPFAPEDLAIGVSRYSDGEGKKRATIGAIPRNTMAALESVLRHAKLAPVSITAGAAMLAGKGDRAAAMSVSERALECVFVRNGGLAAVRAFALPEDEAGYEELQRELRITFHRLPAEVTEGITRIPLYGSAPRRHALKAGIGPALESLGIALEESGTDRPEAGARAGSAWLAGEKAPLEFLKPRLSRMQQEFARLMERGLLLRVGAGVAAAALLFAVVLISRQTYAAYKESKWHAIEADAERVETLEANIRTWRSWYEEKPATLEIASALTRAFPESGDVWARDIQIKDRTTVTCSGFAKSDDACIALQKSLAKMDGVSDLKLLQMRGTNPVQFNLSFKWTGGGSGNGG